MFSLVSSSVRPFGRAFILLVSGWAAALPAAGFAAGRVVAAEDLFHLSLVSQAQIAPNGSAVVFVVSTMDGPKDRYAVNLWLVALKGGAPRALTQDGSSTSPTWSPDGTRLAFVRKIAGKPQIFIYEIGGGRVQQLTSQPEGAAEPLWSHDGTRIAFAAMTVDAAPPAHIDFKAAGFEPGQAQLTSDIRIIDKERYEANGLGYTYDKHKHLWIMRADGSQPTALTHDERWSESQFSWSSDDQTLAFVSLHDEPPQANQSAIYTIAAGGGDARQLLSGHTADTAPVFLRGGRLVYFSGDGLDSAEYPALVTSAPAGSASRAVVPRNTLAWGDSVLADLRMPGGPCGPLLTPDEKHLVTNVTRPGSAALVSVDLATGQSRPLGRTDGETFDCSISADGARVAYIFADFLHPAEVHVVDVKSGTDRALTAINQPYLESAVLSKPESIMVTDARGFAVQAWFMPAVGPQAHGRRPTLLDIHGGPQTAFGSTFFHEMQYWAGLGYNVVMVNPQGSVGYGYAFEEALVGHWGDPMFDDISRVMDVVDKRPDVDASRLGVLGGSYGGYATLWVISHTDRFKAAIAERPCSDLATQSLDWYLASSNGLGGEYAWGKPWDPQSRNFTDSPLTYVENVHTPVMLLHSVEDTETPLDQTLDEYSALKQLGRAAVFVEVPHENHDLNRVGSPIHRVERLRIFNDWFAQRLQ
jgi:dipeptidyl aminopeptidase/acylaminoacyl peptidase